METFTIQNKSGGSITVGDTAIPDNASYGGVAPAVIIGNGPVFITNNNGPALMSRYDGEEEIKFYDPSWIPVVLKINGEDMAEGVLKEFNIIGSLEITV